ncbi:MAG: radical SAM protein, partial [Planctomycetales bacterium]
QNYYATTGRKLPVPPARRYMLDRKKYATYNSIEATRGCPHRCEFCVVPAAWSGVYAHRPIADVIAELETFEQKHAVFIDLSPVEDVNYAKALYRAMIPLGIRWVGLATTRIAEDRELLQLASRSGCRGVLIGFESISQKTLNATKKHFHHSAHYAEVVRKLHDHGIGIQGCFVFGFDSDDESIFERTVEFVDQVHIDLPRYAVVTPFPGTALFRQWEAEGRLLHKDWSLYDVEHVVHQPRQMSPERLQEGLHWSWQQSYRWRSIASRIAGSRCVVPLSVSLNVGYRYFAKNLPKRTATIYRDQQFIADSNSRLAGKPCYDFTSIDQPLATETRSVSEGNQISLQIPRGHTP